MIVRAWATLRPELKAAISAIVECAHGSELLDRRSQDGLDRGSPSCSSPQGACLDGSGGREGERGETTVAEVEGKK